MNKLIIFDGNALIHRSYHALPPFRTRKGQLTNAVYGFASVLIKVVKEFEPEYMVATFDLEGPTFRDLEYKEYKANRKRGDQDLYDQIPLVKKLVESFNIPIYEKKGYEADDLIGTIVNQAKEINKLIITGDLDTLQLINPKTKVYNLKKGINQTLIYGEEEVQEKYGINPNQIIDLKGLKGDPSDNIPGVNGVGEKTALKLIEKFKNIENLYEKISEVEPKLKARLLEYKEDALMSKKLATIERNVPMQFDLEKAKWEYEKEKVIKFFEELEFNALIKRLDQI